MTKVEIGTGTTALKLPNQYQIPTWLTAHHMANAATVAFTPCTVMKWGNSENTGLTGQFQRKQ